MPACLDVSSEDFARLTSAVGAKLSDLTGIPLERAKDLAASVVCVREVDDEGMLTFRDDEGAAVARLPYSAFFAVFPDDEEEDLE